MGSQTAFWVLELMMDVPTGLLTVLLSMHHTCWSGVYALQDGTLRYAWLHDTWFGSR